MRMSGPSNVGRAVQTHPTLLRYAWAITEQKNCWELLGQNLTSFKLCATSLNNTQRHATICNRMCKRTQHVTSHNVGNCWPNWRPFEWGFTWKFEAAGKYIREKSLRHVAAVAKFLDYNKAKTFKHQRSYSILFNLSNVGEIFWG